VCGNYFGDNFVGAPKLHIATKFLSLPPFALLDFENQNALSEKILPEIKSTFLGLISYLVQMDIFNLNL
jgi:hypothetical protein